MPEGHWLAGTTPLKKWLNMRWKALSTMNSRRRVGAGYRRIRGEHRALFIGYHYATITITEGHRMRIISRHAMSVESMLLWRNADSEVRPHYAA